MKTTVNALGTIMFDQFDPTLEALKLFRLHQV